jgi:hypothetical protein
MLDDKMHIPKEEAKVYPPLPKNIYQVELLDISLRDAKGKYAKPGDKNFSFQFTLLEGKDKDNDLRGRNVWANFVPTALYIGKNGKNELYNIVEAFLGRELTLEEEAKGLSGLFLNTLIGQQVKVFVDHRFDKVDRTKIYDNITSYIAATQRLTPLTAEEKEKAKVKAKSEPEPTNEPEPTEEHMAGHVEDQIGSALDKIPF